MNLNFIAIMFFILGILNWWSECFAPGYCELEPCLESNIACTSSGNFSRSCDRSARLMPLSASFKIALVGEHNSLRNEIAQGNITGFKPAARMATMRWDAELASLAMFNVMRCTLRPDVCIATESFPFAGQNVAYRFRKGVVNLTFMDLSLSIIQSWFSEQRHASMDQIDFFQTVVDKSKEISHFTQLVQEKATHVGCGILRQTKGGFTDLYMACNYAMGNRKSYRVYMSSKEGATKCKTGTNPDYPYLCSLEERYNMKKLLETNATKN